MAAAGGVSPHSWVDELVERTPAQVDEQDGQHGPLASGPPRSTRHPSGSMTSKGPRIRKSNAPLRSVWTVRGPGPSIPSPRDRSQGRPPRRRPARHARCPRMRKPASSRRASRCGSASPTEARISAASTASSQHVGDGAHEPTGCTPTAEIHRGDPRSKLIRAVAHELHDGGTAGNLVGGVVELEDDAVGRPASEQAPRPAAGHEQLDSGVSRGWVVGLSQQVPGRADGLHAARRWTAPLGGRLAETPRVASRDWRQVNAKRVGSGSAGCVAGPHRSRGQP